MGQLRASLYDIFGYLIPGAVVGTALHLLMRSIAASEAPVHLGAFNHGAVVAVALTVAYLLGHLAHAVGNVAPWLQPRAERKLLETTSRPDQSTGPCQSLREAADRQIERLFGLDPRHLTAREKFALIDEGRVLGGREGEREVYIHREGFYRGMSVASVLLTLAFVAVAARGPRCVVWQGGSACVGAGELWFWVAVSALSILGFTKRMRRFERYRVERATALWLAVAVSTSKSASLQSNEQD